MITDIRTALKSLGYKVHATRQAKIGTKELVVIVDDVDIRLSSNNSYNAYVWILIEWDTSDGDTIPTQITDLLHDLDVEMYTNSSVVGKATFKFLQSEVNLLGSMYRISVVVEYVDFIDV